MEWFDGLCYCIIENIYPLKLYNFQKDDKKIDIMHSKH